MALAAMIAQDDAGGRAPCRQDGAPAGSRRDAGERRNVGVDAALAERINANTALSCLTSW
jgi:hypothetical protein